MISSRRTILTARLYLLAGVPIAAVSACERVLDVPSNCLVSANPASDNQGFDVIHEQPRYCPLDVPFDVEARGGIPTTFEAAITAPRDVPNRDASGSQAVVISFYDNNDALRQQGLRAFNPDPSDSRRVRSDILGSYYAGIAGFKFFATNGEDLAYLDVGTARGMATGIVFLPYRSPPSTAISGPTSAPEGSSFTLTVANRDPKAVLPLTYEWLRDGVSLGEPSSEAASLVDGAGDPGQNQSYETRTTDAHGYSHSAFKQVWISYAGSPTCLQPPCP